jgi:Zn-dependent M28 family amino/carboxypeptidase
MMQEPIHLRLPAIWKCVWRLYKYHTVEISYTNAVSFAIMKAAGNGEIQSYDRHFHIAGFEVGVGRYGRTPILHNRIRAFYCSLPKIDERPHFVTQPVMKSRFSGMLLLQTPLAKSRITNRKSGIGNRKYFVFPIIILILYLISGYRKNLSEAGWIENLKPALKEITTADLFRHIKILASDEFEGRAPGTRGEQLTVDYLIAQFKRLGLHPGNPNGTYFQDVPMVAIKGMPSAYFAAGKHRLDLKYPVDYVAVSRLRKEEIKAEDSEIVFVGYGIVASEYGWDDYKGIDVKGKTLVILINDPPIPDPLDPSKLDDKMFKGKAMTYYGRWTYKYEMAAKHGAAAAILVHETEPAGYPYEVLVRSWGPDSLTLAESESKGKIVPIESWIPLQTAKNLFSLSGRDFDALKRSAISRSFRPVPIGIKAHFVVKNTIRDIQSRNIAAQWEGSDPLLREQCLVYSAHWDHLGKDETLKNDQIYNGALDNASGTAGLLGIAKAYCSLKTPPKRSILFLALTGEEKGLLGSHYYVQNPLVPLARTNADINMDGLNAWGRTRDIVVVGSDPSPLDGTMQQVAEWQGRRIRSDLEPEKGLFYRSDNFEFFLQGIPTLYTDAGVETIGKPEKYGKHKREEYNRRDYHQVTDEVKPDWDLSGAVEDLQFLFLVGYKFANRL